MIQYESEWSGVTTYTGYPFIRDILPKYISSITIISDKRVYLKSIQNRIFSFYKSDEVLVGTATCTDIGVFQIKNGERIVGYLELCELPLLGYSTTYTFSQSEIMPSCISYQDQLGSINGETDITLKEGYNTSITQEDNSIAIIPNRGDGKGQYCGIPPSYDAIYSINGHTPDASGNLQWLQRGFFKIIEDPDNHKIYFDTTIPPDPCTRPGFPGPQGPKGPDGLDGADGMDASQLILEFEKECGGSTTFKVFSNGECVNCDEEDTE